MDKIMKKLPNVAIWCSILVGYLAFALVGGYCYTQTKDDNLKNTAKKGLIVCLIFFAIEIFLQLIVNFASMGQGYYGSGFYDFMNIVTKITNIAKIVTIVVFAILEIISPKKEKQVTVSPSNVEIEDSDVLENEDDKNN